MTSYFQAIVFADNIVTHWSVQNTFNPVKWTFKLVQVCCVQSALAFFHKIVFIIPEMFVLIIIIIIVTYQRSKRF